MAITIKTLIKVSPMKEDTRNNLLSKADSLTDDQKFKLSETLWSVIAEQFKIELKHKYDSLLLEVSEGKRNFNKNDFVEAESSLYHQFSGKFNEAGTEEDIKQVREQIGKYLTTPFVQDPSEQAGNMPQSPERTQDLMKKVD